jgi:hypothetical protein
MCEVVAMAGSKKKAGKSEFGLVKDFCAKSSDDDLRFLADFLPQTIAFDRASVCSFLQKDEHVDKWLQQSSGYEEFFARLDSFGDMAAEELQSRSSRKK